MDSAGLVGHTIYLMFLLILTFLIVTNYKAIATFMNTGGPATNNLVKTLQGR